MKKLIFLFLLTTITSVLSAQTVWKVDPNHARIGFTVNHMGINDIVGTFNQFDVSIQSDAPDLDQASIIMEIDMNSIDTRIAPRDKHLRSADFFDVEKYPKMTFTSKSIRALGENKYEVQGDLKLHGIVKPVTVTMTYRGVIEDPKNAAAKTMGIQIVGTIKRSDFGIGPKFQPPMIGDVVEIKADGEFKNN